MFHHRNQCMGVRTVAALYTAHCKVSYHTAHSTTFCNDGGCKPNRTVPEKNSTNMAGFCDNILFHNLMNCTKRSVTFKATSKDVQELGKILTGCVTAGSWRQAVWLQAHADTHYLLNMKTFKTLQDTLKCIHYEPWTRNAIVCNNTRSQYINKYISFINWSIYLFTYQFLTYFCPTTIGGEIIIISQLRQNTEGFNT